MEPLHICRLFFLVVRGTRKGAENRLLVRLNLQTGIEHCDPQSWRKVYESKAI